LKINSRDQSLLKAFRTIVQKLSNLSEIELSPEKVDNATSFMVKSTEFFIPMEGKIDAEKNVKRFSGILNISAAL
jgi:valyl-tRNA synthetase